MAFEELPDDIESFFKTGEVPDALKGEITPPAEEPPPVEAPVELPNGGAPTGEAPKSGDAPTGDAPPKDGANTPVNTPPQADYAAQLAAQQQKLDQLTKYLADQQAAEKARIEEANKPVAPDRNTDPLGFLAFQIKQVEDRIATFQAQSQAKQAEVDQQTAVRQFLDGVNSQIEAFKAKTPDYLDAYNYLKDLRTAEYRDRGLSEAQINQKLGADEVEILQNATQQNKNPAEMAYAIAKRYGYTPKAAVEPPKQQQSVESKLDTIKKGIETAGVERGAPPPTYSTDAVKGMSNGQLQDAVEHHWEEMFGKPKGNSIF